tara:strand:+ start:1034 stop:1210 length:177 start_codon:yes stop_codon:yes gene_type:complete
MSMLGALLETKESKSSRPNEVAPTRNNIILRKKLKEVPLGMRQPNLRITARIDLKRLI